MSADLLRDEESLPCVTPRVLRFAGGDCDVCSFVPSHNGPTPSTFVEPSREARALAFLELAKIGLDEALDGGSLSARRLSTLSAQACIASALELLK